MEILAPSLQSLFLRMRFNRTDLSCGTGFIVNSIKYPLLITNRHNVTGLNNLTGECLSKTGGIPNEILIRHNTAKKKGEWVDVCEPLFKDDVPQWIEHPELKEKADFVALPLTQLENIDLHPYSLEFNEPQIKLSPSDIVSVLGFPFCKAGGGSLAIWATGFLATEHGIDYDDNPVFLVDCRTRPGQSGSAVIAHRNGGNIRLDNGETVMTPNHKTYFLGIYSGRINDQSDLGMVWKANAIKQLVDSIK